MTSILEYTFSPELDDAYSIQTAIKYSYRLLYNDGMIVAEVK